MYNKLVKRLRDRDWSRICVQYEGSIDQLLDEAADAIEELSKRILKIPHGRLIDADALKVALVFAKETAEWAVPELREVLIVINEMPTIIPAEENK